MNFGEVNLITANLIDEIFKSVESSNRNNDVKHCFGSALSPIGHVEFTDTVLEDIDKIYYLDGALGTGKSTMLNRIANKAIEKGLDVEILHAPLLPEKIETIVIRDLSIAITTSKLFKDNNVKSINLNEYMDINKQLHYKHELDHNQKVLDDLVNHGLLNIKKAKEEHDKLEQFYIPNMNFEEVNKMKDLVIERILSYR